MSSLFFAEGLGYAVIRGKRQMLTGIIKTTLESTIIDDPIALQWLLKENTAELDSFPQIDGSLKKVYALPGRKLALACFREKGHPKALLNGKNLLKREKQLLTFLSMLDLPAARVYGKPFEINGQYGMLMDWVDNATFIDVKDQDSASGKIISALLGVQIPAGEGWALKKDIIEQEIADKFQAPGFSMEQVITKARKLYANLVRINKILTENGLFIADLQLLIKDDGITIIDPIDVVKATPLAYCGNLFEYTSIIDNEKQTNSDFIKLLHNGKQMLKSCMTLCEAIAQVTCKDVLMKQMMSLMTPSALISPRTKVSLQKSVLMKNLGSMPSTSVTVDIPHIPQISSGSRKRAPSQAHTELQRHPLGVLHNFLLPPTTESTSVDVAVDTKMSPEKKARQDIKENDPDSPSKLLAFQFSGTSLSPKTPTATRCLFPAVTDEPSKDEGSRNAVRSTQ